MSSKDLHRIKVQTWLKNIRSESICDSIHQHNNPAKRYDGLALQYIPGIFYNEMLVVEYIDDISDKYYLLLTSWSHMDLNPIPNHL